MNVDQAHEAIRTALAGIAPEVSLDDVGGGEQLRAALDIDSLDFLALVESLHDQTGVDIPETDYAQVGTVDELSAYLVAHAAG